MKKKSLIMIVLTLVCIGVLSGTIAYFTATSTFNNEFASKPYGTKVTEYFISPDNWTPGTTTDKTVNVENTGEVPVAVRVKFEEKWTDSNGKELPLEIEVNGKMENVAILNLKQDYISKWTLIDGWYYYNNDLQSGETTSDLLESVTFNPNVAASANCVKTNNEVTCTSTGEGYDNATYVLTITIETVQADVRYDYWDCRSSLYEKIVENVYPDNQASTYVSSSDGIDFTKGSSEENGKGIYVIARTKNNSYPIYYYRGDVDDNNVLFANLCWKIIRTTDTGGIKLIYNGKPNQQNGSVVCDNTGADTQIAEKAFNSSSDAMAYVGYSYGDVYPMRTGQPDKRSNTGTKVNYTENNTYMLTSTVIDALDDTHHYTCSNITGECSEVRYYFYDNYYVTLSGGVFIDDAVKNMFTNKNKSTIRNYVEDEWYINNMIGYTNYLEDTSWCADKSHDVNYKTSGWNYNGGSLNSFLSFDALSRLRSGKPSVSCKSEYGLSVANKGVERPVGLITADEVVLAGNVQGDPDNYLSTGSAYWTMTPVGYNNWGAANYYVNPGGSLLNYFVDIPYGVRPVISLKKEVEFVAGIGISNSPYVILAPKGGEPESKPNPKPEPEPGPEPEPEPEPQSGILYDSVVDAAVPDDIVSANVLGVNGIDFKEKSSATNGQGVYMDADTVKESHPIYYYRGNINNNNVLFADFCWKIIRTTDTGGIKLIYNGKPTDQDGKKVCDNTGEDTQVISKAFINSNDSPAYAGYKYTKVQSKSVTERMTILSSSYLYSTDYYFSSTISYANGRYTLGNDAVQYTWQNNWSDLVGYYTCHSSTSTTCTDPYYIVSVTSSYGYYLILSNGNMLDDVNTNVVLGQSIQDNGNNTYTLQNTVTLKKSEWYSKIYNSYVKYRNYYMCKNDLTADTCSINDMFQIINVSSSDMRIVNAEDITYGKSFDYDEGTKQYTLRDTIMAKGNNINGTNYHYTCFNNNGICNNINYVYSFSFLYYLERIYYVTISDGKGEEAFLEKMFDSEANMESNVKEYIENDWYANNMTKYTKYLEDTVWCNGRSYEISKVNGSWDSNGWTQNRFLYFDTYYRGNNGTPSFKCGVQDSLTVANGGVSKPVGLITSDEVIYAGGANNNNNDYYLNSRADYWVMSPQSYNFESFYTNIFFINGEGYLSVDSGSSSRGVRPVVSLVPDIAYSSGNGTVENPYQIVTE